MTEITSDDAESVPSSTKNKRVLKMINKKIAQIDKIKNDQENSVKSEYTSIKQERINPNEMTIVIQV